MRNRRLGHSRRRTQRGQALVEAALTLMVFITLMIGTADFGRLLFYHQSLSERVRAAARYGAVRDFVYPGDEIKNVAVYGTPTPAKNAPIMVPNLTTDLVTVNLVAEGTDAARIRVTISNYPFNFFTPWIAKKAKARPITADVPYELGR